MANGKFGAESSCDHVEDLECDGSHLELVSRLGSIRCSSGEFSGTFHDAEQCFQGGITFERNTASIKSKASDIGHTHRLIYTGSLSGTASGAFDERDINKFHYTESIATGEADIDKETSVHNQNIATPNLLPTNSSMCDSSTHPHSNLRQGSYIKREYWEILLKPDKDGDNLIFMAILLNNLDLCIQMLTLIPRQHLIRGRRNNLFQTALHLAALVDSPALTRRLLVAGVQADRQDQAGNTALHIACLRGNIDVAQALLHPVRYVETKQNAYELSYQNIPQNLEIRNYNGQTCLMIATGSGQVAMIELLLAKHTDVNVKDIKSGMTCLHAATEAGKEDVVQLLLENTKTDINATTYSGFTALDIANIRGRSKIAYLLLCAGAKPELRSMDSVEFQADSDAENSDND